MKIPYVSSINKIKRRYHTGEQPVLVECNDRNSYICKYMRSESPAYKLACELIGIILAKRWDICVPGTAFVAIKQSDWSHFSSINFSAPALGSRIITEGIDVTSVTYPEIEPTEKLCAQILLIGLFDIWIGNEDRNFNNSNLLYNLRTKDIIAIDHGCILNTATFDYPLSQLTSNESILQSDLSYHLFRNTSFAYQNIIANEICSNFLKSKFFDPRDIEIINKLLPFEWNVPSNILRHKLQQLYNPVWIEECIENFQGIINDINYV